jgi:hypothetical protein
VIFQIEIKFGNVSDELMKGKCKPSVDNVHLPEPSDNSTNVAVGEKINSNNINNVISFETHKPVLV